MIFWHIFDISKAYHQKDNNFLHKNQPHLNKYPYIPGFKNFFTLVAVTPDQDLEGCPNSYFTLLSMTFQEP